MFNDTTIDFITRDFEGFKRFMVDELIKRIPEYVDVSENDLGIILIEILSLALDVQSYYIDMVGNESVLHTAKDRGNIVELCNNLGYVLNNATPSKFKQIFDIIPQNNEYVIPKGTKLFTKDLADGIGVLNFETIYDLIIPPNCTGTETDENGEYLYPVFVEEGTTVKEEVLGSSNGQADQEFEIWNGNVIADSLIILVNQGYGWEKWSKVDNFIRFGKEDRVYTVKITSDNKCRITFGNGHLGMIPSIYENGILATYRMGGGTKGNVAPNTIIKLENPVADIKKTFNPYLAEIEGTDMESVEEAKANALISLRTLDRAVTIEDFRDIALLHLPFVLLSEPYEHLDGRTVIVYLLTENGYLTEGEKEQAVKLYDDMRMLGVMVEIQNGTFIPLDLNLKVYKHSHDTNNYNTRVKEIVSDFFKLGNFEFRERFSQSRLLKELLLKLTDVVDMEIFMSSQPTLNYGEVLVLGNLEVEVVNV